jgi:hypothetical protein
MRYLDVRGYGLIKHNKDIEIPIEAYQESNEQNQRLGPLSLACPPSSSNHIGVHSEEAM